MNANFLRSFEKISTQLARAAAAVALVMVFALTILATPAAQAQTYKVIHTFHANWDGAYPVAGLTIDTAGDVYGTASHGGFTGNVGTVFKLKDYPPGSGWVFTTLYSFHGEFLDGAWPEGRVVIGPDGNLYGTTWGGGGSGPDDGTNCEEYGCGTVFKVGGPWVPPKTIRDPLRDETMLWASRDWSSGAHPQGDLTFDAAGNLYGTTVNGGPNQNCDEGYAACGVIYELTAPYWFETILYSDRGAPHPSGGVVFDKSGNLYGVAGWSVYELSPSGSGWTEQTIYGFTGRSDGYSPIGGLIIDASGNLYGTTSSGGNGGGGTVFQLTPSGGGWTFTTLYSFSFSGRGGCQGGSGPQDKLFMDAAGSLYGTTYCDGGYNAGSVFKLTPTSGGWTYTSLHDFTGGSDGANPISSLVFDAEGNLYGTASSGGDGCGVVFEITP